MDFPQLPTSIEHIDPTRWETFSPYFHALNQIQVSPENARQWLEYWSALVRLFWEASAIISIEKSMDTTDVQKEQAFLDFVNNVSPPFQVANQKLKERLLDLDPNTPAFADMKLVLRDFQNEADLFREENIPLFTELAKLDNEYDKVTGGLKADWDGEMKNLNQLEIYLQEKNRGIRERAWRTIMDLWLSSRGTLNQLYADMLTLRQQAAVNAGFPDYRAYAFRDMGRFDYTPADCLAFHEAIAEVVVPAAQRIYEKKRNQLGLSALRPWDTNVDSSNAPMLRPYQGQNELIDGALHILSRVDPELGRHFSVMADDGLLDLETRQGKALGGYCSMLPLRQRPFIFMNGVGRHDDVQTLLHEAGHAFHVFETAALPLVWQIHAPMEFAEVASMAMELLAGPYLTRDQGGFYSPAEAARARIEHLEWIITFLPYMAVVDAFQHWVYTHVDEALDPANCDAAWSRLVNRFLPGVDWSGLDEESMTGWHRKLHIFSVPFYYIEYGMAQVGALQVWRNSVDDQAAAVAAYREALALGGIKSLPELFQAAGAEFRFDAPMLTELITLVEESVTALEAQLEQLPAVA